MTEDDFRTQLAAFGYDELRVLAYEPHHTPDLHTHEFSAMGMVTSGELTIVYPDRRVAHVPGDWYDVPAGTVHSEHTGPTGATALLGTKHDGVR